MNGPIGGAPISAMPIVATSTGGGTFNAALARGSNVVIQIGAQA